VTYFGTYFGEFGYLNSSCIGKSIILMFLSSSRDKLFSFFCQILDLNPFNGFYFYFDLIAMEGVWSL